MGTYYQSVWEVCEYPHAVYELYYTHAALWYDNLTIGVDDGRLIALVKQIDNIMALDDADAMAIVDRILAWGGMSFSSKDDLDVFLAYLRDYVSYWIGKEKPGNSSK